MEKILKAKEVNHGIGTQDMGFVCFHRKMVKWEWYTDIYTRIVFEHLILTANWEDKKWRGITVKRGQRACSVAALAKETGLTVQRVRTAIKHLILTNEIISERVRAESAGCTLFTVNYYDKYQIQKASSANEITNEQQTTNKRLTSDQQQLNNYNNNNNYKKDGACAHEKEKPTDQKSEFCENVYLTESQHELLIKDHGEKDTAELIKLLSRYKCETGKKYSSDYHAIKKWVVDKLKEQLQT